MIAQTLKIAHGKRRGSTLVIVIALLGLLAFTGMVFFTFAAQENAASHYFAEAAKEQTVDGLDDVFDWGLRQLIVGPNADEQNSILYSPTNRFSVVRNQFGSDISPHNGQGVSFSYQSGEPVFAVDQDGDGVADYGGADADFNQDDPRNLLEVVDSPMAWGLDALTNVQSANRQLSALFRYRGLQSGAMPAPDVDYTSSDHNNMFLGYRGLAIRDNAEDLDDDGVLDPGEDRNGNGVLDVPTPRYELIPVTIPSFMRPVMMKTAGSSRSGVGVPADPAWATDDPTNLTFARRSFRPHPSHIVRDFRQGLSNHRYFRTAAEATAAGVDSGPFPFFPDNQGGSEDDPAVQGELGIWTGSWPTVVELDVDNDHFVEPDGATTREGIWLDLHFPIQETVTSGGDTKYYVPLHSFTVYDLDALMNVNVHGNVNNLDRNGRIPDLVTAGDFEDRMLSASNLGMGPHEINPTYTLRRDDRDLFAATVPSFASQLSADVGEEFISHYGDAPSNALEQANMEWFWLVTGRADFSSGDIDDLFAGRWGDVQSLYLALNNNGDLFRYPRPGRADNQLRTISANNGVRFGGDFVNGGVAGFDDNGDSFEGEALRARNQRKSYGQPLDFAGTGSRTTHSIDSFGPTGLASANSGNPLTPRFNTTATPVQWPMYDGYSITREIPTSSSSTGSIVFSPRYIFGQNQTLDNASGDDLISNPFFDALFEDPLETVFDYDLAIRPADQIFGPQDTFEMHMTSLDISSASDTASDRLSVLAPWALSHASTRREMVTTISNSYRFVPLRHPYGNDGRPGQRGVDDDADNYVDEPDEVLVSLNLNNNSVDGTANGDDDNIDNDTGWRWQEWTADTDGADRHDGPHDPGRRPAPTGPKDGFPDGDGNLEFPPAFGNATANGRPYSVTDPFRPQVRRLITVEAGDRVSLLGQLPLSPNHLLDVDRTEQVPAEGTPAFLRYMQQSGLRFRELIPHPDSTETGVSAETDAYQLDVTAGSSEDTDGDDVFATAAAVPFPSNVDPSNTSQWIKSREFWARRDRQQLARDIYVLLYTLGGGQLDENGFPIDYTANNDPGLPEDAEDPSNSGLDPAAPHPNGIYTHEQLRRMAQIAVNLVDSMDEDDVITKFEYDKNLGNGWNLDDDPSTDDGFAPAVFDTGSGGPTDLPEADYNAVTAAGFFPEDSGVVDTGDADGDGSTNDVVGFERGVVYGVEGQQLAFNEYLAIHQVFDSATTTMDSNATMHDDLVSHHDFLQVEIQNVTPVDVSLGPESNDKDDAIWRIARFDRSSPTEPMRRTNDFNSAAVILRDALTDSEVAAGSTFTISTGSPGLTEPSGGSDLNVSDFYVDVDSADDYATAGTWERIAPDIAGSATSGALSTLTPGCDIDMHHDDHLTTNAVVRVLEDDGDPITDGAVTTAKGAFLDPLGASELPNYRGHTDPNDPLSVGHVVTGDFSNGGGLGFDLVLQRRLNPNMPHLSEEQNPWVNVDVTKVVFQEFRISDATTLTDVIDSTSGELRNLASRERSQPLNAAASDFPVPASDFRNNTIGGSNSNAATWNVWQPHFNRAFHSVSELLGLPLYGPESVTQRLVWSRQNPYLQTGQSVAALDTKGLSTAESMFLQPDFPNIAVGSPQDGLTNRMRDNRWYRALQFIEVPSRVHRMLGNYLTVNRIPGKLNVNMIRHREIFAGLIDDTYLLDVPFLRDQTPFYTGASGPDDPGNDFSDGAFTHPGANTSGRDMYHEFINERDELISTFVPADSAGNSVPGETRLWVPGTINSRPFRPFANENNFGVEDSILRRLAADLTDSDPETNRLWAEVGTTSEHQGNGNGAIATFHERQQLLSKLMNNTTTVSNCFIVFASVGFFEAAEDANGLVQVGGAFDLDEDGDTLNDHRRAVFIIDRTEALNAFDPGSGEFNWERLVKARLEIQ